jgi:predicted DNA-binding protein YlxM (UPF0122 family)
MRRGKAPLGEASSFAKLSNEQVMDIRSKQRQRLAMLKYIRENLSLEAVAKQYDVAQSTITCINSYRTWGHIE